jgi:hypothetical protein
MSLFEAFAWWARNERGVALTGGQLAMAEAFLNEAEMRGHGAGKTFLLGLLADFDRERVA